MAAIEDFETFRSSIDMVYLTLHNPLCDIPTDDEFAAICKRTKQELYASLHKIRLSYRKWNPTSPGSEFTTAPIHFNDIDDYYPPPYSGPKNDAKFKVYMINLRREGLKHLQYRNKGWLENTRKHHSERLERVLDIYCNHKHAGIGNFESWERHWIRKYMKEHPHMTEINVLSAIPSFDEMVDYLDEEMFLRRTLLPIHNTGAMIDTIVCFQRYMSRGYFKKAKSRFYVR